MSRYSQLSSVSPFRQVSVLRPRLDRRARIVVARGTPPRSRLHLAYVALDALKVVTLPVLGSVLVIEIAW